MDYYGVIVLSLVLLAISLYRLLLLRWAAGKSTQGTRTGEGGALQLVSLALGASGFLLLATFPVFIVYLMTDDLSDLFAIAAAGLMLYVLAVLALTLRVRYRLGMAEEVVKTQPGRMVLAAGALVVAVVIAQNWRAQARLEAAWQEADAQLKILSPEITAGMPNAADLYRPVFRRLRDKSLAKLNWELKVSPVDNLEPLEQVPAFPAEHETTVQDLQRASQVRPCDWLGNYRQLGATFDFPWLKDLRQSAELLRWHALAAAKAGHLEEALEDVKTMRRMADHLPYPPLLATSQMAIGMDSLATKTLENILPQVKEVALLEKIELRPRPPGWGEGMLKLGLQGEVALVTRTMAGTLGGKAEALDGANRWTMAPYRVAVGDRDILLVRQEMGKTLGQLESGTIRIERDLPDSIRPSHFSGGLLASSMVPSLRPVGQNALKARAQERCLEAALAAKRHQLQTGHLPDSFEQLVKEGSLQAIPQDPFGQGPLCWRLKNDELRIYSVGENDKDNGEGFRVK